MPRDKVKLDPALINYTLQAICLSCIKSDLYVEYIFYFKRQLSCLQCTKVKVC